MTSALKSKSNITSNRAASPIGECASGPWDVVVLCESAMFPGLPDEAHVVLMDNQTGIIAAYNDAAMVGDAEPIILGVFHAVGKRITKPPKP